MFRCALAHAFLHLIDVRKRLANVRLFLSPLPIVQMLLVRLWIVTSELLEQIGLTFAQLQFNVALRLIEGLADFFTSREQFKVEFLRKHDSRFIKDKTFRFDAYDMLSAIVLKYPSYFLRLAGCHENHTKLRLLPRHKLTEVLVGDQLTVPLTILEEQEVAHSALVLPCVCLLSRLVLHTMAGNVQDAGSQ